MESMKRGKVSAANLRLQYPKILEMSLIVAIAIFVIAFRFLPEWEGPEKIVGFDQDPIDIEDVQITQQEEKPPPPAHPPVIIEKEDGDILDDLPDVWPELDLGDDIPLPRLRDDESEEFIFRPVEDMPQIIGGIESIQRRVVYPRAAIQAQIEGTVYVYVFVSAEGKVVKTEVINDPGGGLGAAAEEAIRQAEFIPGKQRDQPVAVRVVIPVHFRLQR